MRAFAVDKVQHPFFFVRKDELYNAVEFFLGVVEYLICREWWS